MAKNIILSLYMVRIVIKNHRMMGVLSVHVEGWKVYVTKDINYNHDVNKPAT